MVYAWTVLDTHFHLLVWTGRASISSSMRKVLTGYAVNFNRRHRRHGHLSLRTGSSQLSVRKTPISGRSHRHLEGRKTEQEEN
jgi:hypothetical protein